MVPVCLAHTHTLTKKPEMRTFLFTFVEMKIAGDISGMSCLRSTAADVIECVRN